MKTDASAVAVARRLRREMSPPERLLWLRLKAPRVGQPRFRRQHPLGPYVLDFYCTAAKLVVEVDGWSHNMGEQAGRDEQRDAWLSGQGLTVVRVPAADVLNDPDEVADGLQRLATERA